MPEIPSRRSTFAFGGGIQKHRKGIADLRFDKTIVDDKEKFIQQLNGMLDRLDSTVNEVQNTVLALSASGRASTCIVLPDIVFETPKTTPEILPMVAPFPLSLTTPVPVAGLTLLFVVDMDTTGAPGYGTTPTGVSMVAVPVPGAIGRAPSPDIGGFANQSQQWQIVYIAGLVGGRRYLCRLAGIRYPAQQDEAGLGVTPGPAAL